MGPPTKKKIDTSKLGPIKIGEGKQDKPYWKPGSEFNPEALLALITDLYHEAAKVHIPNLSLLIGAALFQLNAYRKLLLTGTVTAQSEEENLKEFTELVHGQFEKLIDSQLTTAKGDFAKIATNVANEYQKTPGGVSGLPKHKWQDWPKLRAELIMLIVTELQLWAEANGIEKVQHDASTQGSIAAKVTSYEHTHEIAKELGYPDLTEALEVLADYQAKDLP